MKNLLFIFSAVLFVFITTSFSNEANNIEIFTSANASEFCNGWEDGYCEGWRDVKGANSICPLTPLCPLPELFKDRYRDGYHRGFRAGYRAAQR